MTRRSILGRTVAVAALLLSGAVHALVLAGSAPGLRIFSRPAQPSH